MEYTEKEIELRKDFYNFQKQYKEEALIKEFDEKVAELNNPALSAYFARLKGPQENKHRDIVLKGGNLEAIYELSDLYKENLDYIIDSHNVEYNLKIIKKLYDEGVTQLKNRKWDTTVIYDKDKEDQDETRSSRKQLHRSL